MPHFTLQISPGGPVLNAIVMVSEARRNALTSAGQVVPTPVQIRALIDTGASSTCVEPEVLANLQLTPISQVPCYTPSTGGTPVDRDQYEVGLFIPGSSRTVPPFVRGTLLVLASEPKSLEAQGIQALIGRDVLEHCMFHYNGTNGFFSLAY